MSMSQLVKMQPSKDLSVLIRLIPLFLAYLIAPSTGQCDELDIGRRIYEQGILPDGSPLIGMGVGDFQMVGAEAACANCHRSSGMGGLEGSTFIAPISADFLFHPEKHALAVTDPSHPMGITIADHDYSDSALATVIKDGINFKGQSVNPAMPRYALDDQSMSHLVNYLHNLSATPSPGVDADAIHFATVFTPEVDEKMQALVKAEIEAFALQHNSNMSRSQRHRTIGFDRLPHKARPWNMHFWTLTGDSSLWQAQLEQFYRQQPVFALVSGVSFGAGDQVQDFCDQNKIPCLLRSELYAPKATSNYSVYFSRGLGLDASLLATGLKKGIIKKPQQVFQLMPADATGERVVTDLGERLQSLGIPEKRIALTDQNLRVIRHTLKSLKGDQLLVCWCQKTDLQRLGRVSIPKNANVYLSGSWLLMPSDLKKLPTGWQGARVIYPYELPDARLRQLSSFYTWISGHHFETLNEIIQSDAYFAMLILQEAIAEMVENLYRDYLLERVENIFGMSYDYWGIYSRPSLGQGHRYSNRTGYIVKFSDNHWVAVTERIVEE